MVSLGYFSNQLMPEDLLSRLLSIAKNPLLLIPCAVVIVAWLVHIISRHQGVRKLEYHAACNRLALKEWREDDHSGDWAKLNCDLGDLLVCIAEASRRKKAIALFDEAASAYQSALEVYTEERYPRERNAAIKQLKSAERKFLKR